MNKGSSGEGGARAAKPPPTHLMHNLHLHSSIDTGTSNTSSTDSTTLNDTYVDGTHTVQSQFITPFIHSTRIHSIHNSFPSGLHGPSAENKMGGGDEGIT